jgi:hypothetical protein
MVQSQESLPETQSLGQHYTFLRIFQQKKRVQFKAAAETKLAV